MEQDPASLLQMPEQWCLWLESDPSFSLSFTANELQTCDLQNYEASMLDSYHLQPTPDLMLADIPPSAPLGSDVGLVLGLDLRWCMDLVADDPNTLTSYGGSSRYNTHSSFTTGEIAASPCFPLLGEDAQGSASLTATTQSSRLSHNSARRRVLQPSSFQVPLEVCEASDAYQTHKQSLGTYAQNPKQTVAGALIQPPKPPLPVMEAVGGPSALQASAKAQAGRVESLPVKRGHPQHPEKKRPHSATPNASLSSDRAGGPIPSNPNTTLSHPAHRSASSDPSQGQSTSKVLSVAAVPPRGRRDVATRASAKVQQRKRGDWAALSGDKNDVMKASVPVSEYQQHVMNLIEAIKKEIV